MMLLPLQGALLIPCLPRAMPWARCFCPFRACGANLRNFNYLRISFSAKLARMLVLWLSMRMNSCAEFFMYASFRMWMQPSISLSAASIGIALMPFSRMVVDSERTVTRLLRCKRSKMMFTLFTSTIILKSRSLPSIR